MVGPTLTEIGAGDTEDNCTHLRPKGVLNKEFAGAHPLSEARAPSIYSKTTENRCNNTETCKM